MIAAVLGVSALLLVAGLAFAAAGGGGGDQDTAASDNDAVIDLPSHPGGVADAAGGNRPRAGNEAYRGAGFRRLARRHRCHLTRP